MFGGRQTAGLKRLIDRNGPENMTAGALLEGFSAAVAGPVRRYIRRKCCCGTESRDSCFV